MRLLKPVKPFKAYLGFYRLRWGLLKSHGGFNIVGLLKVLKGRGRNVPLVSIIMQLTKCY